VQNGKTCSRQYVVNWVLFRCHSSVLEEYDRGNEWYIAGIREERRGIDVPVCSRREEIAMYCYVIVLYQSLFRGRHQLVSQIVALMSACHTIYCT
jgi:hypothetical protein